MTRSEEEEARIADLLAVARRRDREAFGRLFDYYAPRVKAYLRRLGADEQQAEELTQEVMLAVWRRAAQYDPRRATPGTWIFRIARNRRIDALRRERRPPEAEEAEVEAEAGGEEEAAELPGAALEAASEALLLEERLRAAIARLPPEQAEILRLYYLEEKPQGEIADALGLPLGTVKSRLRLALAKLRDYFAENKVART